MFVKWKYPELKLSHWKKFEKDVLHEYKQDYNCWKMAFWIKISVCSGCWCIYKMNELPVFVCCSPFPQPALLQRRLPIGGEFSDIRGGAATVGRPLPPPDQPIHSWRTKQPDEWAKLRPEVEKLWSFSCQKNLHCPLNVNRVPLLSSEKQNQTESLSFSSTAWPLLPWPLTSDP